MYVVCICELGEYVIFLCVQMCIQLVHAWGCEQPVLNAFLHFYACYFWSNFPMILKLNNSTRLAHMKVLGIHLPLSTARMIDSC